MFHCPKCQHAAHVRTSRYLSENTKERYHQCTNVHCSCTFVTLESIERFIRAPVINPEAAATASPGVKKPKWL